MTTLLAHIEIKPGREAQFEDIMKDMVQKTLSEEDGVLRYEYFKGQQDNFYYCLLAFRISGRFTRTKTPLTTRARFWCCASINPAGIPRPCSRCVPATRNAGPAHR